jgi:hypothetical protein
MLAQFLSVAAPTSAVAGTLLLARYVRQLLGAELQRTKIRPLALFAIAAYCLFCLVLLAVSVRGFAGSGARAEPRIAATIGAKQSRTAGLTARTAGSFASDGRTLTR